MMIESNTRFYKQTIVYIYQDTARKSDNSTKNYKRGLRMERWKPGGERLSSTTRQKKDIVLRVCVCVLCQCKIEKKTSLKRSR